MLLRKGTKEVTQKSHSKSKKRLTIGRIDRHSDVISEGDLRVGAVSPREGVARVAIAVAPTSLRPLRGLLLLLELLLALGEPLVAVEVLLDLLEPQEDLAVEEEEGEEREDAGGDAPHPVDVDDDVGAVEAEEGGLHVGVGARRAVLGEMLSREGEQEQILLPFHIYIRTFR